MKEKLLSSKPMELLAPAGDQDALKAALAAGADAVYLGGTRFNARQSAANFDAPALRAASDLLHLHGKKLYVTVNTLIGDDELEESLRYLAELYNLGADAVIIQDIGLIRLARQYLPQLELHASTQMTIHNHRGALYLKELGLKRAVLARELTAAEVASIAAGGGLEVEVFAHGALCVCYSGQCLMSSMIGGRSGNRGRCAQPCRMEYQLVKDGAIIKTQGSYLLSPKDLALAELIPELAAAGVRALKIEGRMKRPEYVYGVVSVYRCLLDRYYQDPAAFRMEPGEMQELEEAFNRGFSSGYFGGNRNAAIMNFQRPNNRGVYLGRVAECKNGRIRLPLEAALESGDEVEIWVSRGGRAAFAVMDIFDPNGKRLSSASSGTIVELAFTGRAFAGDRVFKIVSARLRRAMEHILSGSDPALTIPCSAVVSGSPGKQLTVTYTDASGISGEATSAELMQKARTRPLTDETLREQLGRLGNTPFRLEKLENRLPEGLMIPVSALNQARREAILALTTARLSQYNRSVVDPKKLSLPAVPPAKRGGQQPLRLSVWVGDLEGVTAAAAAGAELIYAGGDELRGFHWNEKTIAEAAQSAHAKGAKLIAAAPRLLNEGRQNEWLKELEAVARSGPDGLIISDLGGLQWALAETELPIYLNYPLNIFNQAALAGWGSRIKQVTLSPELTLAGVRHIHDRPERPELECLVHGPLELMVSEYCPPAAVVHGEKECARLCDAGDFALRDRLGLDFAVRMDQFCRMHLLNSKDLCLYGELEQLARLSGLTIRLELKSAPAAVIARIVRRYREALDALRDGRSLSNTEEGLRELRNLTGRGITKGHFFRGVE